MISFWCLLTCSFIPYISSEWEVEFRGLIRLGWHSFGENDSVVMLCTSHGTTADTT